MITIEQRGKNLLTWKDNLIYLLSGYAYGSPIANGYQDTPAWLARELIIPTLKKNTTYTFSATFLDYSEPQYSRNAIEIRFLLNGSVYTLPISVFSQYSAGNQAHIIYLSGLGRKSFTFTTPPDATLQVYAIQGHLYGRAFNTMQLEEGSVATPYEDPWVNTLNFDEALMSGEQIQQDGNKFYLINNWHRTNTDPYETVTFSGGTATLSESSQTNSSIVVDIDTGEVKNSLNSGTTVQVYLNQYDSWTTDNATTTAFNLTKVSLTNDYPIAINGNVTTSGFTQSTTQIVFDNPVASGSSVSCVYPYLDMNYNSQAKVFYKKTSTSRDEVTYTGFPFELTDGINHIAIQDQLPAQLDVEADDVDTAQSISFPTDLTVNEEDVLKETDTKDHRRNSLRLSRKVTGSIARLQDSTFLEDFKDVQFRIHYHNSSTDGILLDEYLLHAEFTKNSSNLLAKDLADSRDFVAEKKVIQHA